MLCICNKDMKLLAEHEDEESIQYIYKCGDKDCKKICLVIKYKDKRSPSIKFID